MKPAVSYFYVETRAGAMTFIVEDRKHDLADQRARLVWRN